MEDATVKASVFIGTSVDGFIARANGALDFLPAGGGEPHGYDEFMASVDALVIGRKTFETVLTFDAWPYPGKPGGITIQRFLQAGLIQRLIITRVPVLIGTGVPLFGALAHDIALTHVATRQYASGLVQSEYVVAA
jgi:dihydrofolate reductase